MIVATLPFLAVGAVAAYEPASQTEHIAAVANLLAGIERGTAVLDGIRFEGLEENEALEPQSFISFATECPLTDISVVPSTDSAQPTSVSVFVSWDCHDYRTRAPRQITDSRKAAVFFRETQITLIQFGIPEVIRIGAESRRPENADG